MVEIIHGSVLNELSHVPPLMTWKMTKEKEALICWHAHTITWLQNICAHIKGLFVVLQLWKKICIVCFMVFNTTFNNIAVISWQSVLLVEETGQPGENHRPVTSHWQTLSHNVVHLALIEIRTHNTSGDRHYCIGSCKSKYHDGPKKLYGVNIIYQCVFN
jgi:hypothetical protein